jgi:hypothetical protein
VRVHIAAFMQISAKSVILHLLVGPDTVSVHFTMQSSTVSPSGCEAAAHRKLLCIINLQARTHCPRKLYKCPFRQRRTLLPLFRGGVSVVRPLWKRNEVREVSSEVVHS